MIQPEPEDLPKDNPKLEIAVLRFVWRDLFAVVGLGLVVVVADELSFYASCVSNIQRGIVETIVSAMSSMMSCVGAHDDSEFVRRVGVLLQEMVAAYDDRKDDRRIQRLRKLQMDADLMAYEKENLCVRGFETAREINALCARVTTIVDERDSFVDELDMLVGRPVPGKMAEFMKHVQGKDIPNLMKLQILGREFELRAQEKDFFIEKLKGNVDF
ncbi:hypothetical protein Tco_0183805 [Tanacetum coccineum]